MTVYRPQTALARWRVLTVIIPHTLIAAVGVDHTMSATHLALAREMAQQFAGTVLAMSAGKCFVHNLIVEYPGTWDSAELLIPATPASGYVLRNASLIAPLADIGINALAFDTINAITHETPFDAAIGGIANYDPAYEQASAHSLLFDSYTTIADVPMLMTHEWLHGVCYFYFLHGGAATYIDLDTPANYRYLNNSAIPNAGGFYREFMSGVMVGNVELSASGVAQEITDTEWGTGTPRKNFP